MQIDTAASAHTDALAVTLVLLGIVPLVWRHRSAPSNTGWLFGTFFVAMSALIKYTTGLVALFYFVPWAQRLPNWRVRALWIGGACALTAAVTYVLFIPWF